MMEFNPGESMKFLYPILIGFMVLEYFTAKEEYHLKDTLAGFGIAAGASVVTAFTLVFTITVVFQGIFDLFEPLRQHYFGYTSLGWAWWAWALCIIGDDFNFYWHHRFSHTIRLLWAAHVPHHSSNNFNLAVSIRNGWFIAFYKPIFWLWLAAVGFEPVMIGYALVINSTYQYFLHTRKVKSLGWLGKVFNNPYVHQVHHSSNLEYLDKNHGGIFMIWDHLFGTYQDVLPGVEPKYGILKDPKTYNPIKLNTHEFQAIYKDVKQAKTLRDGWMYIFGPPGWCPNGTTQTAKQLQAELEMSKA